MDTLSGVDAALTGPLRHRAELSRNPAVPDFSDPVAEALVAELELDAEADPVPTWLADILTRRVRIMDDLVRQVMEREPATLLVNVGAGLSTRKFRLPAPPAPWVDVDTAAIVALRRRLIIDRPPRSRFIAGKIEDDAWLRYLPWKPGQPIAFVSEGTFAQLAERDVRLFLERIAEGCPGADVIFDTWSAGLAERVDAWRRSEGSGARMRWTPKEPTVVRTWHRHLLVGSVHTMGPGASVVHVKARP